MTENVYWVLEVDINDGKMEDFKALAQDMVAGTRDEPGALNYEWSLSPDQSSCHIFERYADSAATMVHLGNFGANFAARFLDCVTPTRFTVYGSPSDDVKGALAAFGAAHMNGFAGFVR